jgi:hypothetical protein
MNKIQYTVEISKSDNFCQFFKAEPIVLCYSLEKANQVSIPVELSCLYIQIPHNVFDLKITFQFQV